MTQGDCIWLGDVKKSLVDAPAPKKPLQGKPGTPGEPGVGWEVQYSEFITGPWHDTQTLADNFRHERLVGAAEWGPATLIVGIAGADGAAGQYIAVAYKASTHDPATKVVIPPEIPTGNGPVPPDWSPVPYDQGDYNQLYVARAICNADGSNDGWEMWQFIFRADFVKVGVELSSPTITGGIFRTAEAGRHVEIGGSTYYASIAYFDNSGNVLADISGLDNGAGVKYLSIDCVGSPLYITGPGASVLGPLEAHKIKPSGDYVDLDDSTGTFVQDFDGGDPWKVYFNKTTGKFYVSRGTEYHSVSMP